MQGLMTKITNTNSSLHKVHCSLMEGRKVFHGGTKSSLWWNELVFAGKNVGDFYFL